MRLPFSRRELLAAGAGIALCQSCVGAAGARRGKLAPIQSEEGDGPLKVQLVDLSPRFLDFFEAAKHITDPVERFSVWESRYGFAAVPPTPEGRKMARELLDAAWPKYPAALDVIRAGAKAMQPQPLSVLKSVAAVLKPSEPVTVRVNAYVGGFEVNAFTFVQDGLPAVCVPLEMEPSVRRPIFVHEMTHAVHIHIARLSGGWERSIAATALPEGLAMHVTREVLPGLPITEYVGGGPGWWNKAQAAKAAVLRGALPYLESRDADTVFKFTLGQGTTGLEREAYLVGWLVVEQLRGGGMDLPAIARVPESDMPALVRKALRELGAPTTARKPPRAIGGTRPAAG